MIPESDQLFVRLSRQFLRDEFLPRVRGCLDQLSVDDVWWRPNEASNSIGNLVLHLSGNLRQWIVAGVGGEQDHRDREREFAERSELPVDELLSELARTVEDAVATLDAVDESALAQTRVIQGREVTVMEAVYHAVEHFSMHTGQILLLTKMRLERDLGFYRIEEGIPRKQWKS